jgi:hypothetical protein
MNWLPTMIGIVLAIPLSVLANLFTPKIRNWWATRSRKSLTARIAVLESELVESEAIRNSNELSANILRMVTIAFVFFWLGGHMILSALLIITLELAPPNPERVRVLVLLSFFVLAFNGMSLLVARATPQKQILAFPDVLRRTIGRLKDELARLQ